ncbi:MAG: type II toxin-antitoxin system RelE/ParE family toxin, partial [Campylobacteraceae bacterium]|nr:type II toxin-antitoxin system RelE/ParE family toxin [Campylobacteraceae bacterium]
MKVVESDIYLKWLSSLKDTKSRRAIDHKKDRIEQENYFGDCKNLGDGVSELRFSGGAGHRIYYHIKDGKVYFLRGGDKSHQQSDINKT